MKYLKIPMMLIMVMLSVSVFAQDSTSQQVKSATPAEKTKYTCSMHPGVISSRPGKCPKCGMALVKMTNDKTKTYTCPMHPEVISNKPGKCPKCKMALKEKKEDSSL